MIVELIVFHIQYILKFGELPKNDGKKIVNIHIHTMKATPPPPTPK